MSADVILNPNARHLAPGSPLRRALLDAASRWGARVHETATLEALAVVARDLAARGTSAVVLAGGDGSYMAGVSALALAFGDRLPPIALAPGGTVGVVARNLSPGNRAHAARLVQAVCEGKVRTLSTPTLHVRDDAGGDRVAFIFGAGLVAQFFDVYDAAPRQGVGAAAVLAGRAFLGSLVGTAFSRRVLSRVSCSLEVDGQARPSQAWSLLLASVVPDVGLGIRATYRAGEDEGRFHLVASTRTPRGLATQVPRVLTGRAMVGPDHVDTLARSLRVTFEGVASYVLDGDVLRAHAVTVEAGPVVRVLVPA